MTFDPVRNDNDFRELEKIAVEEFEKFRKTISDSTEFDKPIVDRKGKPGGRREIWVIGEIDPLTAMTNETLIRMGIPLGNRELFSRMLVWWDDIDFPVVADIMSGKDVSFEDAWRACQAHVGDSEAWTRMTGDTARGEFSTTYYALTSVIIDPGRPRDSQVEISSSNFVKSPYLLDEEDRGAKPVGFSEWFRRAHAAAGA